MRTSSGLAALAAASALTLFAGGFVIAAAHPDIGSPAVGRQPTSSATTIPTTTSTGTQPGTDPSPTDTEEPQPTTTEPLPPGVSWLEMDPEQARPGSTVDFDVACLDDLGPLSSPAFDIGPLRSSPEGHQPWHLYGTGTVRDVAAGYYDVTATCGSDQLANTFRVLASDQESSTTNQVPVVPRGPVQTGGGGTAPDHGQG